LLELSKLSVLLGNILHFEMGDTGTKFYFKLYHMIVELLVALDRKNAEMKFQNQIVDVILIGIF
jgi:hypothetical protein